MLEHYFEPKTNNKKWIWIVLIVALVALMAFFLCKKNKKKRYDTESYDYLATGDECTACNEMENNSIDVCAQKGA